MFHFKRNNGCYKENVYQGLFIKSRKCPPPSDSDLVKFEKDLLKMLDKLEFKRINDPFQRKIQEDINFIKNSDKIFVPADKTCNYYEMTKEQYEKTALENITKTYKKCNNNVIREINLEAKEFAEHFCVDDKLEIMAEQPCFFTIKDHKDDFRSNPKYRLINPNKSELGLLSKKVLQDVNDKLRTRLNVNQWQNSTSVIKWFNQIHEKSKCSFLVFDVQEFYPSIGRKLLCNALEFAGCHVEISQDEEDLVCELVGFYILYLKIRVCLIYGLLFREPYLQG